MLEYRLARPDERRAYVDFINFVFTDDGTAIDFPTAIPKAYAVDARDIPAHHIAVDDRRGIVSVVGVLENDLFINDTSLRVGYVGSVSTHPDARGEGHMKALMARAEQAMRASGCDLALLGGQRQRYEYYGYVPGGICRRVEIDYRNVRHALRDTDAEGVTFVPMTEGSAAEADAKRLYETFAERFARPRFAVHCRTYRKRPLAAYQGDRFLGWLCAADDPAELSELFAADDGSRKKLLKAWITQNGIRMLRFPMPEWDTPALESVGTYCERMYPDTCVNVQLFHRAKTVAALLTLADDPEDGNMDFDIEGERFRVTVKDGRVTVGEAGENARKLTGKEADMLFLCPMPYAGKPKAPRGWFPLKLSVNEPDEF